MLTKELVVSVDICMLMSLLFQVTYVYAPISCQFSTMSSQTWIADMGAAGMLSRLQISTALCCHDLPFGILGIEETLEDADDLLEALQVYAKFFLNLLVVVAELAVEVLAVRAGAHGGAEDGLHEEAMVGL
jgi:hypothetical protein